MPATIQNGYFYQFKNRQKKEEILSAAKRIREDPGGAVSKSAKLRQVYCVSKRRFYAEATQDEMNTLPVFKNGLDNLEDVHRIIQCRLM